MACAMQNGFAVQNGLRHAKWLAPCKMACAIKNIKN
jgi:hypothetical protein